MVDEAISQAWPPTEALALDGDQLLQCYAVADRGKPAVRFNFVSSIDGAATADGPVFTEAPVRAIVVTTGASPHAKREALSRVADVIVCGEEKLDARGMLGELAKRRLRQVLCEGGPTLFGALLEADGVDELCLTISPSIEAGDAPRIAAGELEQLRRMALRHVLVSASTLMLVYRRDDPHSGSV